MATGNTGDALRARFYCLFWETKGSVVAPPVISKVNTQSVQRGWVIQNYAEIVLTCPVPHNNRHFAYVSVVQSNEQPSNYVKIVHPPKPATKPPAGSLGVCVKSVFGNLDPYKIIEWVELWKLLGASHFNLYDCGVPDVIRAVIMHYVKQGIVEFAPAHDPKGSWNETYRRYYDKCPFGAVLSFNDCLYI